MKKNFFFIIGTGRCGTQMLRNILKINNNNIIVLPETHFVLKLYDKYQLKKISTQEFLEIVENTYGTDGVKWIRTILNSTNKRYETYKQEFIKYTKNEKIYGNIKVFISAFYEYLYGKNFIFADKTPYYGANLEIILKIWPNAKIIYLKRDGINSAISMMKHRSFISFINNKVTFKNLGRINMKNLEKKYPNKKPTIEEALKFWKNATKQIDESIVKTKKLKKFQILNLRYEDFIFDTKKTSQQLTNFLNLRHQNLFFLKTLLYIKPFLPLKNPINIHKDQYARLYKLASFEMQNHNYPYIIKNNKNIFFELLRIFGHYIFLFTHTLKIKFLRAIKHIKI